MHDVVNFHRNLEPGMEGFKAKLRVGTVIAISVLIVLSGLYGLLRPIQNGCVMTYMYPTYIPISAPKNLSSMKYGLYLYHEGWKKIDFDEHLKQLSGVPVLFIPGNCGSYKQVRSLAKESNWAYTTGPLERTFYQEASLPVDVGVAKFSLPNQYSSMLDWFAVDLEGEHSAMDGRILEEHTEYVVYAIHRILDQYKESRDARAKEGAAISSNLPKSVILVGHSMGGFVARAAIVHPHLRKSAVETIVTLSSPHQSPPVAMQPSLGYYFASINQKWRKGYEVQVSHTGRYLSDPVLSNIIVVSISGGINDYQVRSKLETLDGIVPPSHGFMISSKEMKNVWLSMEHQTILWCNQLVVQVSHALLSLIDSETGQPFHDRRRRLAVFTKMLHSGLPQGFKWKGMSSKQRNHVAMDEDKNAAGSQARSLSACPKNVQWSDDSLEKDLYVQTTTVTVLAMDGRRRWLDIQKLGSNGKSHFVVVTNLAPCYGVRIHLWPEKGTTSLNLPFNERVVEVTSKMVQIPSGPAPRQIEPGSQTEQPSPSAVFWMSPEDMKGFRFITISVAPRPAVSGRPPPAASMAVGQFFDAKEGVTTISSMSLLLSSYSQKEILLKEDHPLALNLSFAISLGLLPVTLSLTTTSCGIKNSALPDEEAGDVEKSRLCKLRCFPPVALAWDSTSGLHIYPNLHSETITVDSAPALWGSAQNSEKTIVLLLVDPHCAYRASYSVSFTAAASRFLLLYCSKIVGLTIAAAFFALMRQARAWELHLPVPSMLTAVEYNMRLSSPFLLIAIVPILIALLLSLLSSQPLPSIPSFVMVTVLCYIIANASITILVLVSQLVFYLAAVVQVFFKARWQVLQGNFCFAYLDWFVSLFSKIFSFKVLRAVKSNLLLVTAMVAIILVCFVHPALGLSILLILHASRCHNALSSFLTASFRSLTQRKEPFNLKSKGSNDSEQWDYQLDGGLKRYSSSEEDYKNSKSVNSYSDIQVETFHQRHGLLILHLLATLMFLPSLVAWLQRTGNGQRFPSFLDSVLCIGIILHGTCDSKPESNFFSFAFPGAHGREVRSSVLYMLAGYFSFLSAMALAPYRSFYAIAILGVFSFSLRSIQRRFREKRDTSFNTRKHSHRH